MILKQECLRTWRYCLINVLLLLWMRHQAEAARYTLQPPELIQTYQGQQVWFPWIYDLEGGSNYYYACGHHDGRLFTPLGEAYNNDTFYSRGLKFKEQVVVFSSNRTISIRDLTVENNGTYYCSLLYWMNNTILQLFSRRTLLLVNDSPSPTKAVQSTTANQRSLSSGAVAGISIGLLFLVLLVVCLVILKRKILLSFVVNNYRKKSKGVNMPTGETNQGMEYEVPEVNPKHNKQAKNPLTVFKERYEYLKKNREVIETEFRNTESAIQDIPGKEISIGRENFEACWSREPDTEARNANLGQGESKFAPGKYSNATYVTVHSEGKEFIAAKFPWEAEQNNFWEMVFVNQIKIIALLCNLTDCDTSLMPFWPVKGIGVRFGRVKVINETEDLERTTTTRRLVLQDVTGSETKRCVLYHFHMWPQLSVPKDKQGFTQFLRQYLLFSGEDKTSSSPSLIMCGDGARQCGTFIAICTLIKQLEGGKAIDVFNVVKKLREIKPEFVGSLSHYQLCYDAVFTYSKASK